MVKLARRVFELIVLSFAAYAFAKVPLGKKTGLEHARAIWATEEAQLATDELGQAGKRLLTELIAFETPPYRGQPLVPPLGPEP